MGFQVDRSHEGETGVAQVQTLGSRLIQRPIGHAAAITVTVEINKSILTQVFFPVNYKENEYREKQESLLN